MPQVSATEAKSGEFHLIDLRHEDQKPAQIRKIPRQGNDDR